MKTSRELWETIERLRLLPTGEAERVKARWFREGREGVEDASKFASWLVANDFLSKYAIDEVRHGRADRLRLGNYLLLGRHDNGPHAGSFRASDTLGRQVLVDVVDEKLASDADVVRAFEAAAERVMGVQSPHVNRVIDFGKADDRLYLVRELDEGVTLAEILAKRDRLQPDHSARLFSQAFAGLQALHEKQVQGGDLTTQSLLLAAVGKKGRVVKLLRPGMPPALFLGGPASDVVRTLRPVARPEDDLFQLGQAFYQSLTGKPSEATLAGAGRPRRCASRPGRPGVARGGGRAADLPRPVGPAACRQPRRQDASRLPGQRGGCPGGQCRGGDRRGHPASAARRFAAGAGRRGRRRPVRPGRAGLPCKPGH
ncbi:MAG: hypothetical protein U0797_21300 [Gemmataceae bacterium]